MTGQLFLPPLAPRELLGNPLADDPVHVLVVVVVVGVVLAVNNAVVEVQMFEQFIPGAKLIVALPARHLWASDVVLAIADDQLLVEDVVVVEGATLVEDMILVDDVVDVRSEFSFALFLVLDSGTPTTSPPSDPFARS